MKRLFMATLMMGAAWMGCRAQDFRGGVTVGMTVNTPTYFGTMAGYYGGWRGEMSFDEKSSPIVGLGLMLSDKSWRYTPSDDAHIKAHPTYFDIPFHAGYRWEVSPKVRLFATAGPTVSIGVFGKEKASYQGMSQTLTNNVFDNEMERIDFALGYRFGIELNRNVQISVSQDWGLRNIDKHDNVLKYHNRCFTLALTYMF